MKLISHFVFSQLNAIVHISENYVTMETASTNSAGKNALELYADERT
jgi:5-bromo-4-chloroindolyl phosphate hydrolysis protein